MIIYINWTLAYLNEHDPERLQKLTEIGTLRDLKGLPYLIIEDEKYN